MPAPVDVDHTVAVLHDRVDLDRVLVGEPERNAP
jgi:hypothetical protein